VAGGRALDRRRASAARRPRAGRCDVRGGREASESARRRSPRPAARRGGRGGSARRLSARRRGRGPRAHARCRAARGRRAAPARGSVPRSRPAPAWA